MCSVDVFDKLHPARSDYLSNGGGRMLPGVSTTDAMKYIRNTINFIDIWLQTFDKNYVLHCNE